MKAPKETDLVRLCLDWLKLHGILCWRQNQGSITPSYNGKRRFLRFAGIDGISDILGVLPPSGRLLAVECKRKPNKPTPEQLVFLDQVRSNGGLAVVAYSLEDLERAIPHG